MIKYWFRFWYKSTEHYDSWFGSNYSKYSFDWQQLFNVLIVFVLLIVILLIFKDGNIFKS